MSNWTIESAAEQALHDDLVAVCAKHEATRAAFACDMNGRFVGFLIGKMTVADFFLSVCNVGRLWQFVRQTTRDQLDKYEVLR